jgi:hypothetical protein
VIEPMAASLPRRLVELQLMPWKYLLALFGILMRPKSCEPPLRKRAAEISYFDQYREIHVWRALAADAVMLYKNCPK